MIKDCLFCLLKCHAIYNILKLKCSKLIIACSFLKHFTLEMLYAAAAILSEMSKETELNPAKEAWRVKRGT